MILSSIRKFFDHIFPNKCQNCAKLISKANVSLCMECWTNITLITNPRCELCGRPKIVEYDRCVCYRDSATHMYMYDHDNNDDYHDHNDISINDIKQKCVVTKIRSAMIYRGVAKKLIKQYKFDGKLKLRHIFANTLYLLAKDVLQKCDVLIPVPLHKNKLRSRGYNQSAIIGKLLAQKIHKPYNDRVLIKTIDTVSQNQLRWRDRTTNVNNAFEINERYVDDIKNMNVALIDDVATTGSTINACAHKLRCHGASDVQAITIARTA